MVIARCGNCGWIGPEEDARREAGWLKCPLCKRMESVGYVNAVPGIGIPAPKLNIHELRQLHGTLTGHPMEYGDGQTYHTFGQVDVKDGLLAEPFLGFPAGTPVHKVQEWFASQGMPEAEAYAGS